MKKIVLSLMIIVGIFVITGCSTSDKDKMLKKLRSEDFYCVATSSETICTKEDNEKKKIFKLGDSVVNYEETIYDEGTTRLVINISNTEYIENDYNTGIIKAYFKGEDVIEFYPETCEDGIHCHLHVDEKVYPELKEEYDDYKEYFNSESYRDYLRLKNKNNKSLQEKYEEFRLETTFEIYSEIKDKDQFTENVNEALRYFEKTLDEAGIKLKSE